MRSKVVRWLIAGCLLVWLPGAPGAAQAGDTRVGAHVKISAADYVAGTHNGRENSQYGGLGFFDMILYVYQDINDFVSVDLQPEFSARTGATPKLGSDLGAQRTAPRSIAPEFDGWVRALVKTILPYEIELSAGIVKPRFTWEYGAELYWGEEYHGSKFSCNNWLASMHDAGLEFYRAFELSPVSIPVYLYLLNGGYEFGDNNRTPMVMLRVEPQFYGVKLGGAYAQGKWDDRGLLDVQRFSAGAEYAWENLTVRGEFAAGRWQRSIANRTDAVAFGYYAKAIYRIVPWMGVMLHYNLADHNFNSFFATAPGAGEKYQTLSPVIQLYPAQSSEVFIQWDLADWRRKDDSDLLKFNRFVVGWKNTF